MDVSLTVTFTDLSSGQIDSHLWTYREGITSTASTLTHTHAYTASGVYTVSLTVSDVESGEWDTEVKPGYITATAASTLVTTTISYAYDPLYRLISATYSTGEYRHPKSPLRRAFLRRRGLLSLSKRGYSSIEHVTTLQ